MKKRLMIIGILCAIVICTVGATYAFFTYTNTSEKSEVITGEIYMNYEETKNIYLTNVFPETKASALARTDEKGVFEFSITGRNTSEYPIYYEIDILEGDVLTTNGEVIQEPKRVLPEHVMIYLERDGEVLVDGMTFKEWNNRRIWVETIPAGTQDNISHNYTLRMWIDERVTISDTDRFADYTTSEWNDSYASLKVRVIGNLEEKTTPYDYMARLGSGNTFWPSSIDAQKANITEVNFVQMLQSEIDEKMADETITIKEDVSDTTKGGSVSAWLENGELITNEDGTQTQYYIMYVASDGTTYFPSNCMLMFLAFTCLKKINFENIDTSNVTIMAAMFSGSLSLIELDLNVFDTSNVTGMNNMFMYCTSLTKLNLNGFDTGNVTYMQNMFAFCPNLTEIDLRSFDVANVIVMSAMFGKCSNLKTIYANYDWNVNNLTDISVDSGGMFYACNSLVGAVPFDSTKTDITMANPDTGYFTRKEA